MAYSEYVRTHALFVANPAALECKLVLIVQLHGADGTTPGQYLTIGQVVAVHLDRAYPKEGLFDLLATILCSAPATVRVTQRRQPVSKWSGRADQGARAFIS